MGSDVYVAGWEGDYYSPVAKYWKNGQAVTLGTSPSFAWSIAIFGTDVYVAGGIGGWGNSVAVYWKNGQAVSLPNGSGAGGIVVVN